MTENVLQKQLDINVDPHAGTIKFSTTLPEDNAPREWPKEFYVRQSVNILTYDDVYDYFTNDDKWFSLSAVKMITGSGQRRVGEIDNPYGTGKCLAMSICLDGVIDAATMNSLFTMVQQAGHLMLPKYQSGAEGSTVTVFTIIPQYEMMYGKS